jgi:uncharacterized protein YndB with AHSA1/START domain/mannose-6-phosphate isomerase-like protein (cupin superfamily)
MAYARAGVSDPIRHEERIRAMTTLRIPKLGVVVEIRKSGADTGGELVEFDVIGRARGIIAQPHVHLDQTERHEVIEGSMRLIIDGREHLLRQGESMTVPVGATHRQLPGPDAGPGRVRVQLRPAGDAEAFLHRLAEMDLNRFGFPPPVAAAELVRDFSATGHAARPPLRVQRALSKAILALTSREYLFVDEWDVAAPREAVFDALADARSYPQWWKPVYVDVDGEPALGKESRQHFKGRLPYHLHTRSRIVRLEPPHVVEGEVDGDLRGHGRWTLTDLPDGGTHVRFDWRVHADRPLLRVLTPILRPAFRWNHAWAIARAVDGLEPYARSRTSVA